MLAKLVGLKVTFGRLRTQCPRPVFLLIGFLVLFLSSNVYGQATENDQGDLDKLHGGIEIGPGEIKASAIRASAAQQGYVVEVVYTELIHTMLVRAKDSRLSSELIRACSTAVQKLYTRMQQQYQVPTEHIYIICNSRLRADNLQDLESEVKEKVNKNIIYLNTERELRYNIVGTIPLRYLEGTTLFDNRNQSLLLDIGSDIINGGYQQVRQPLASKPYYDFVTIEIPVGLITFTDEINQEAGENADLKKFALYAGTMCEKSVKEALRKELENKPGLVYRKKVYLSGGIVQILVTLLHPEDRRPLVPITVEDINAFYQRVIKSPRALLRPDLSQIRDLRIRREVEKDLESFRKAYTPKNLIAGAEILRSIVTECNFVGESKKIEYARFSHFSLILSYLRLQAENLR